MQDRYAGDIGDFGKFGLLRRLSDKFSVGINWYDPGKLDFECDEQGNYKQEDGRYRDFSGVENCDKELADKLLLLKEEHTIEKLEGLHLIENAVYFGDLVPRNTNERKKWHCDALNKLNCCDVIFLDPDNGLLCKSVKKGSVKSVKYTYYDEVNDYLKNENNKAVIVYNHRSRKKESVYFDEIKNKLRELSEGKNINILIVSFRKFSVRDYFILIKYEETYRIIRSIIETMLKDEWGSGTNPFAVMINGRSV